MGLATDALDLTMQLALGLIVVRAGVYIVGLMLGPRSWLHNWEPQVTLSIWLAFVFHLIGWFSAVQARLDNIDLLPGNAHFSLWSLLKSIVVVTGFVLVCSLIARAIEQRVMKLVERRALHARRHHQVQSFFPDQPRHSAGHQCRRRRHDRPDAAHRRDRHRIWASACRRSPAISSAASSCCWTSPSSRATSSALRA